MPIPDFQSIMLPLLQHLAVVGEESSANTLTAMAEDFKLTQAELEELLPSGKQSTFSNRIAWAKSYLKQAHLLDSPRRGVYRINDRGRSILAEKPPRVDIELLKRFPEFLEFRAGTSKDANAAKSTRLAQPLSDSTETPEERIEDGVEQIREALRSEMLERIASMPPSFFERAVVDLLVAMGYGGSHQDAARVVGQSGDEGIDGIIKEDRLGLESIYVQAKRWKNNVGRPDIQRFAGALQGQRARKGVFITTSAFSQEARDYAHTIQTTIVLIDGRELADLMIEHGVGVTTVTTYAVKRLDSDYFSVE
jgi:restriction system protein